jgi:hypothetical protein
MTPGDKDNDVVGSSGLAPSIWVWKGYLMSVQVWHLQS